MNRLALFDVVKWGPPGEKQRIWVVTIWGRGSGGITLGDAILDIRSEGAKLVSGHTMWVCLDPVGSAGQSVALDVDQVFAEGAILNSRHDRDEKNDDDDDEDDDEW